MSSKHDEVTWILVDWADQRLLLIHGIKVQRIFPISTSEYGLGEKAGSERTPLGWHRVAEKHGDGLPDNAVMAGRKWTGEIYQAGMEYAQPERRDWILTRILWLQGLEPGKNQGEGCDSYSRYIYIHGAPDSRIERGHTSKGCINLTTPAMLTLFALVEVGTPVCVVENRQCESLELLSGHAQQAYRHFIKQEENHVN